MLITASTGIVFMFIAFVIYPAMNKSESLDLDAAST
jgi:hypothetical protein